MKTIELGPQCGKLREFQFPTGIGFVYCLLNPNHKGPCIDALMIKQNREIVRSILDGEL